MKYQVYVDKGVTIAGRRYPHGAIVDTDSAVDPVVVLDPPPNPTEEEKVLTEDQNKKAEAAYAAKAEQAKKDIDENVKKGWLDKEAPPPEPEKALAKGAATGPRPGVPRKAVISAPSAPAAPKKKEE